jgi:oligosaccharide repeat unit polymerase
MATLDHIRASTPAELRLGPQGRMQVYVAFVLCAGLAIAATLYLGNELPLTALALLTCLIAATPILVSDRKFDLFAPWNYMFYWLLLNLLVRCAFIDLEPAGSHERIDEVFLLGKPKEFLLAPAAVMVVGFAFLTFGYLATPSTPLPLRYRIFRVHEWYPRRFGWLMTVMLMIAIVALGAFVQSTFSGMGDLALAMLSKHRGVSGDLSEYNAHGYLRLLVGLASIVMYLTYVRLRTRKRKRVLHRVLFTLALLVATAMAFYTQSRAALVFTFLNILFIKYYVDRQRFPWLAFSVAAPAVLALFVFVSSLRGGSGVDLSERITPETVIAPIVLHSGGIDASKTGHVLDYVDATQDYQFGQTLVQFVWSVVPRSLWPGKPVNLDTFIGEKIYGAEVYGSAGVPPGFFAEMYLNFWYAGIVLGALVLGAVIRKIDCMLVANKDNLNFILVYVIVLQQLGMSMLASGVSSTILGVLAAGIPLVAVLYLITPRVPRGTPDTP